MKRHARAIASPEPEPRHRVLVVDDDPNWLELLGMGLRLAGFDVVAASNAKDALSEIALRPPALAVLDARMPDSSGVELGTVLRDRFDVRFMIMSADDDEDSVRKATSAGAIGYLRKTGEVAHLVATIRTALMRRP